MFIYPYKFVNDKVYEYNAHLKQYLFFGYFCTFGIYKNMLMSEKINKVLLFGIE